MTQRSGRGQLRLRMAVLAALSVLALLSGATLREVQAQGWADVAYQAGSIRHFGRSEVRGARSGFGRARPSLLRQPLFTLPRDRS